MKNARTGTGTFPARRFLNTVEYDWNDFEILGHLAQGFEVRSAPLGLELCRNGICVGYLNFQIFGGVAELCDLLIMDAVIEQSNSFWGRLWRRKQITNYRNSGLGTSLLRFFIEYVEKTGLRRIEGQIVSKDLEPQPWLPDWYRHHGFSVAMGTDGKSGKISLDLEKCNTVEIRTSVSEKGFP